jgi:hypothetical protein
MSFFARFKVPLFTALAMLAMVLARVLYGSVTELREGQRIAAQDPDNAIVHLERAIHWYVPFSPTVSEAAQGLWDLGQAAEKAGNAARALEAYQALRGGFYATRSFYTPYPAWISRANERIASLQARDTAARWPDPVLPEAERKAVALRTLERDDAPDPGWSFLAVLGFVGWVGSGLGFMLRAFDPEGHFRGRAGLRWGAGIVAGYALWVLGLLRA